MQETRVQSLDGGSWRREWQPAPVFLPGESQGQRSLAGYSPWGHKESDTTEWLTLSPGRGSKGPKCTSLKATHPLTVHEHPGTRVALTEANVSCVNSAMLQQTK